MKITFNNENEKLVIKIRERLDTSTYQVAEDKIQENIGDNKNIILDFSELDYISSAGLRVLLEVKKDIDKKSGTVEITG